ncbi:MAG: hypothetical protein OXC30_05765 [Alphaproteobacteria bacterium]|nr:hypothetical protein [Alphaproteobacteria bacterium]
MRVQRGSACLLVVDGVELHHVREAMSLGLCLEVGSRMTMRLTSSDVVKAADVAPAPPKVPHIKIKSQYLYKIYSASCHHDMPKHHVPLWCVWECILRLHHWRVTRNEDFLNPLPELGFVWWLDFARRYGVCKMPMKKFFTNLYSNIASS